MLFSLPAWVEVVPAEVREERELGEGGLGPRYHGSLALTLVLADRCPLLGSWRRKGPENEALVL